MAYTYVCILYICAIYAINYMSSKSSKMSSHSYGCMLAERGGMSEWVAQKGSHDTSLLPHYLL